MTTLAGTATNPPRLENLPPRSLSPARHLIESSVAEGVRTTTAWGLPLRYATADPLAEDRRHVLHRRAARGERIRIRPGVFVDREEWNSSYPRERHLASALATSITAREPPQFCRETALLFYGLPLDEVPEEITRRALSSGASGYRSTAQPEASLWPLLAERRIAVPAGWTALPGVVRQDQEQLIDGRNTCLVEDLRHCLADTLPRLGLDSAVMVADAMLSGLRSTHDGGLCVQAPPWSRDQLAAVSLMCRSQKAARKFTWLAEFADAGAASPGESLSRLRIHELGFEAPVLQHRVRGADGRSLGFLDFWWAGIRVAGEFDGWKKYTDADSYSGVDRDLVFRQEKRRTERIQEEGIRFVRWMWEDLRTPERLATKLAKAGVPRSAVR
ncbi:hypothetical protein [Citricoccus sp. I39-566]|uniref:hypothetical protein n=1 Tax=Citricoccus sp. I39-566 TaxID=3073268 RepID=UPI00286CC4BD|nr:hypothetical protein [Citricoccus sp. I39-566]WMY78433.1 hypothetical protein RE421_00810 [Citricoccus sp. I39-566]